MADMVPIVELDAESILVCESPEHLSSRCFTLEQHVSAVRNLLRRAYISSYCRSSVKPYFSNNARSSIIVAFFSATSACSAIDGHGLATTRGTGIGVERLRNNAISALCKASCSREWSMVSRDTENIVSALLGEDAAGNNEYRPLTSNAPTKQKICARVPFLLVEVARGGSGRCSGCPNRTWRWS